MNKKIIVFGLIIWLLFIGAKPMNTFSKEVSHNGLKGFSYEVIFPDNQKNKDLAYYDLLVKAGQHQTIQLKLNNSSSKEQTVMIRRNSAKTNRNGVIDYGPNNLEKDPSLQYDFPDIVKGPAKVRIPANESKTVAFTITMPEASFPGYIAGGIQLEPVLEEETGKTSNQEVVKNRFAFLIGVLLSESETKKIEPMLKLNHVQTKMVDGQQSLVINMSNIRDVFAENMEMSITVRKQGKEQAIFDVYKDKMRMAPNSRIEFPVELADKQLTKGTYTAQIEVSVASGLKWSWSEEFNVTAKQVAALNDEVSSSSGFLSQIVWWIIGFGVVGVALLLIVRRKRKWNR